MNQHSQCECGQTQVEVHGKPIIRAYCHCQNCQAFNQAPFADVAVFYADDVVMPAKELVEYKSYGGAVVAVPRGKCRQCGKAAIETMKIPGLKPMVLIPAANFSEPDFLPQPKLHMFYHRRVADISDDLPKYSGFLRSQLGFVWRFVGALIKHKR